MTNAFSESKLDSLKICQFFDDTVVFFRAKTNEGSRDSSLNSLCAPCVFWWHRNSHWLITWCHWKLQVSMVRHASPFLKVDILDPGSLRPVSLIEAYGCGWPLWGGGLGLSGVWSCQSLWTIPQAPPSTLSSRHLSAPHLHIKPPLGLTYVGVSELQGIWCVTMAYLARGLLDLVSIVPSDRPSLKALSGCTSCRSA